MTFQTGHCKVHFASFSGFVIVNSFVLEKLSYQFLLKNFNELDKIITLIIKICYCYYYYYYDSYHHFVI